MVVRGNITFCIRKVLYLERFGFMKKAYSKDIWRSIKNNKKRFFSIMLITALGVTMLSGLRAACQDLRYTADKFYDEQHLFDIQVISTLGLEDTDIEALKAVEGLDVVEGTYSENINIKANEKNKSIEIKSLSQKGINVPYILEGRLPQNTNEIIVNQKFIDETGKKVGEVLNITDTEYIAEGDYTITGVMIDAMDVNGSSDAVAFRASMMSDYTAYILPQAFESEVYTSIYITVKDAETFTCYSDEYDRFISNTIDKIDSQVKEKQEEARYNKIIAEAESEIAEAESEANEEFEKAESEIASAKTEISDGKKTLTEGETEVSSAIDEIASSREKIESGQSEIQKAKEEIAVSEQELENSKAQLASMEAELLALQQQIIMFENNSQLSQGVDIATLKQQLEMGNIQLLSGKEQLVAGEAQIAAAKSQIELKEAELNSGLEQLTQAEGEIETAKKELEENRKTIEDADKEIIENEKKLAQEKEKAYKEIADAKKELEEIEMTQWYIQDRSTLGGYVNIETDASCIEAVGTVFPIIFFIVAILISLTTITRMVEEERGLIGTYKALGFTDSEIRKKYVVYASLASLAGCVLGDFCGFIMLPKIIFVIFTLLYQLPKFLYQFDCLYGIAGALLFPFGIVGATIVACEAELSHMPASLMRPKAPKSGSRVLLERITPIWSKMSFLNKVTARNLFRYKKRMFMTIGGIMGCTSLVLCGFVIKDSVTELLPSQYDKTFLYDAMIVANAGDNELLVAEMNDSEYVDEYINLRVDSVKVKNTLGEETLVQLIVEPEGEDILEYINIADANGINVDMTDDSIYITQNAANILELTKGSKVMLQDMELVQQEVEITDLVRNYMGNMVYMSQSKYEELFGEYENNAALLKLSDVCADHIAFADDMQEKDWVLTVSSIAKMKEEFQTAFYLINVVVYIIIVLAAGLALVVLFTLSTTNISERERELATIKVLGFFDNEVHLYVNKETLILTGIGIVLGLPLGHVLGSSLTAALEMPSIYFAVSIYPISYVFAALISFGFALIVDLMTNRTLDNIDPVEALKSIE